MTAPLANGPIDMEAPIANGSIGTIRAGSVSDGPGRAVAYASGSEGPLMALRQQLQLRFGERAGLAQGQMAQRTGPMAMRLSRSTLCSRRASIRRISRFLPSARTMCSQVLVPLLLEPV